VGAGAAEKIDFGLELFEYEVVGTVHGGGVMVSHDLWISFALVIGMARCWKYWVLVPKANSPLSWNIVVVKVAAVGVHQGRIIALERVPVWLFDSRLWLGR
jgi:hypothetical protein